LFIIYRRNQCQILPVFVHLICKQWCYAGMWDIFVGHITLLENAISNLIA
jgi:hypothetical protein